MHAQAVCTVNVNNVATVALLLAAVIVWLRVRSGGHWPKSPTSPSTGTASSHTSIPISSNLFDLMKLESFWVYISSYLLNDIVKNRFWTVILILIVCMSAVEQLLSPGCSLPDPGVIAAGELLKRQKSKDLPKVSTSAL